METNLNKHCYQKCFSTSNGRINIYQFLKRPPMNCPKTASPIKRGIKNRGVFHHIRRAMITGIEA